MWYINKKDYRLILISRGNNAANITKKILKLDRSLGKSDGSNVLQIGCKGNTAQFFKQWVLLSNSPGIHYQNWTKTDLF